MLAKMHDKYISLQLLVCEVKIDSVIIGLYLIVHVTW